MEGNTMGEELKAVWFAAGTAAVMACIERAVVESLFTHWRVWAFLALNLLLLGILFTSKSQTPSNEIDHTENNADSEFKKKSQLELEETASTNDFCENVKSLKNEERVEHKKKKEESFKLEEAREEDDTKQEEAGEQFSKEELNQRVEAFIAKFRQHLISDAQGKSCGLHYKSKCILEKSSRGNAIRSVSLSQSNKYIRA